MVEHSMAQPTVFLVDDDPIGRDSINQILQSEGISVEGYSASGMLLNPCEPSRPGCLVLDMYMENTNGLCLYRDLVKIGWQQPFIIITEHGEVSDIKGPVDTARDFSACCDFRHRIVVPFIIECCTDV